MIEYTENIFKINPDELNDFFVDWQNPPSSSKHYEILKNSDIVIFAVDSETKKTVGFINALTDKVLFGYIPLLEVLPDYHGKGIGKELMKLMINKLKDFYAIDLCCDEDLEDFYRSFGFQKVSGMVRRNFQNQNGEYLNLIDC